LKANNNFHKASNRLPVIEKFIRHSKRCDEKSALRVREFSMKSSGIEKLEQALRIKEHRKTHFHITEDSRT
jgi:hypothetical protein